MVTPTNINGIPSDQIDGGATRGANLFHSFQEFNIGEGQRAFLTNPAGISNILSRVTGNDVSDILGTLGVLGNANLFLINPNGIIFGPNASLDIGGSFLGSTASAVNFADGTSFSATASTTAPLLTVSVPIGLQYGGIAGSILNQSSVSDGSGRVVGLQVYAGETLALLGGDVRLDGGRLNAPSGQVELGGLSGAGIIGINGDGSLSYPAAVQLADVFLTNGSGVDVAGGGGSIAVNARNLDISGESFLHGGIVHLGSVNSQAGDITLNATGEIKVSSSDIFNQLAQGSVGNGGNIKLAAVSVSFTNGARLNTKTFGQGDTGSVTILARDTVSFDGARSGFDRFDQGMFNEQGRLHPLIPSIIVSSVESGAVGNAGDVNITTGTLSFTRGALVYTGTSGKGNAGSVNINARDTVSFNGEASGVITNVNWGAEGNRVQECTYPRK